ncbi:MAG: EAL domain-containing protein [Alphaproteobacteria bacterium]
MNYTVSPPPSTRTPVAEQELLSYAARLAQEQRDGRLAFHIHFSRLQPNYQRPDYIRIATETFRQLIAQFDGKLFVLLNKDLVFVARNVNQAMLELPVGRIRALFSGDHLAQSSAEDENGFVTWHYLDRDYRRFHTICQNLVEEAETQLRNEAFVAYMVVRPDEQPLKVTQLARIEEGIAQADLASVIHKQSVCTIIPGHAPEKVFDELFVAISDLRTVIAPQINLAGNRWLFQYLTQALDQRVLTYLQDTELKHQRPFSMNLNVATVLSETFQRFNTTVAAQLRKTLVLEFSMMDVFADLGAFFFARDYLHDYGYRICLDGMSHLTLPHIDRKKLGFDLVKLQWNPRAMSHMNQEQIPVIRQMIMAADQARVILCRCESTEAIRQGQELGIVMFQGREVDRLISTSSRAAKPVAPR